MFESHNAAPNQELAGERPIAGPREVRLDELLQGDRELLIRHGDELYHLRITKNGRLLLTK
jgi:hemin uptake protein HemP